MKPHSADRQTKVVHVLYLIVANHEHETKIPSTGACHSL